MKFWWCAYAQLVGLLPGWPEVCPICGREVSESLSAHHALLGDFEAIPWGEF